MSPLARASARSKVEAALPVVGDWVTACKFGLVPLKEQALPAIFAVEQFQRVSGASPKHTAVG